MSANTIFRVGLSRDGLKPDGTAPIDDYGLGVLEKSPGLKWALLDEHGDELTVENLRQFDALLLFGAKVPRDALIGLERLALVARLGVGYENVDIDACTEHGVIVTITPDGVRRPMAVATLTFVLALSQKLLLKDRLVRSGLWRQRANHLGIGLTGRTLGVIGLGNIGREFLTLAEPLGMRHIAYDPYVVQATGAEGGAELVDLETLLGASDFVCVLCPSTPETYHLIGSKELALMKPEALLINTARGPIVDHQALVAALREGVIAGAGLDVFEYEPLDPDDPIQELDNVIVTPHSLCWTDECFAGMGRSVCESILDVAAGRVPRFVVNPLVLELESCQQRLRYQAERSTGWRTLT